MVIMASLFISVKLFGFISTTRTETPYKTWDQCVNSLDIKYAKVKDQDQTEIVFLRDRGYLAVTNKGDYTKQMYSCQKQ